MGIGTLRRYHPTIDPNLEPAAQQDEDPRVREHQAAIEAATAAFDAARDASTAAQAAAAEAPDSLELAEAAQKAAEAAQAAQQALEDLQQEFENQQAREALYADAPKRTANKAEWIAYAGQHGRAEETLRHPDTEATADQPAATGKAFTRDEIAELFLGPKA